MRTLIRISNIIYIAEDDNIERFQQQQFNDYRDNDVTWGTEEGIARHNIQSYLNIPHIQCSQQKKISILQNKRIKFIPPNIVVPFIYKKIKHIHKVKSYLSSKRVRQNIYYLSAAQRICNNFQPILQKKIKYDFFKSVTGRAAANIGVIKKQQRVNIKTNKNLIQFDFNSFQPFLYSDYFLNSGQTKDAYENCKGQTRQQKKISWYEKMFSNKQKIQHTSVFGRTKQQMLVYHLQALQTDCMSRLLVQLDKIGVKMKMFLYDGILFDAYKKEIQVVFQEQIDWEAIFPKSNIVRYPYKIINIK